MNRPRNPKYPNFERRLNWYKITKIRLAEMLGVNCKTLCEQLSGRNQLKLQYAIKIAEILEEHTETLFKEE